MWLTAICDQNHYGAENVGDEYAAHVEQHDCSPVVLASEQKPPDHNGQHENCVISGHLQRPVYGSLSLLGDNRPSHNLRFLFQLPIQLGHRQFGGPQAASQTVWMLGQRRYAGALWHRTEYSKKHGFSR